MRRFNWLKRRRRERIDHEANQASPAHNSRLRQPPLQTGQLWRMAEANLSVGLVGKLLVHYKLGKPEAVRVPISINCIKTVEKYLKTKRAVLVNPLHV